MQNHLKNQTSPYLLQHADNPVDWYPWCREAFARAKAEDKPVFLSIGYSTCHWCHVMAHESFEDEQIAEILNQYFIAVKVDKEERPDIDSIYMSVCQAFTGSGGWPTTIFLTPEQKPFFAGTYFSKTARYGQVGLAELLLAIRDQWKSGRTALLQSADEIVSFLDKRQSAKNGSSCAEAGQVTEAKGSSPGHPSEAGGSPSGRCHWEKGTPDEHLLHVAVGIYKRTFDRQFGGFGEAPKFPTPHNLLFLLRHYERSGEEEALHMVEKTLLQMYRGGMFDHIGGGFSRYSTDRYFLVPHFEKMLYDNALLILAYCKAYQLTENPLYREVAERSADYILREMTSPGGGFYSAQDADSEGVEGKYYLLEPSEIIQVLGEEKGSEFNRYFGITEAGNFEGKNIPNLLWRGNKSPEMRGDADGKAQAMSNGADGKAQAMSNGADGEAQAMSNGADGEAQAMSDGADGKAQAMSDEADREKIMACLPKVYEYRKNRYALHLDDKILTGWNGLMIAAMCHLYRVTEERIYLDAAVRAQRFILDKLCGQDVLYVSYRDGKRSGQGFLDDYAFEVFALLALYEATLDTDYLEKARRFCHRAVADFHDEKHGGFFLYGRDNEQLILRPKETYDGAIFSGNSAMAYNLVQLYLITGEEQYGDLAERQLKFMSKEAEGYPAGYAMFLRALSDYLEMPDKITIVQKGDEHEEVGAQKTGERSEKYNKKHREEHNEKYNEKHSGILCRIPLDTVISVLDGPTEEYPLKNDRTTFYVCRGHSCQPPVNELEE